MDPTSPTEGPTSDPTVEPTIATNDPTFSPTLAPTDSPSMKTYFPTAAPSASPTQIPSSETMNPSMMPTKEPSVDPTVDPTVNPTLNNNVGFGEDTGGNNETLYLILAIVFGLLFFCMLCLIFGYFWKKNKTQKEEVDFNNAHIKLANGSPKVYDLDAEGVNTAQTGTAGGTT